MAVQGLARNPRVTKRFPHPLRSFVKLVYSWLRLSLLVVPGSPVSNASTRHRSSPYYCSTHRRATTPAATSSRTLTPVAAAPFTVVGAAVGVGALVVPAGPDSEGWVGEPPVTVLLKPVHAEV